jgi:hypothetical protein
MTTTDLTETAFETTVSAPAIVLVDGILVFSQPGALPAPALEQLLTAVRALDMDDVRAKVAAKSHQDA